jgi:hypothetical protein
MPKNVLFVFYFSQPTYAYDWLPELSWQQSLFSVRRAMQLAPRQHWQGIN